MLKKMGLNIYSWGKLEMARSLVVRHLHLETKSRRFESAHKLYEELSSQQ